MVKVMEKPRSKRKAHPRGFTPVGSGGFCLNNANKRACLNLFCSAAYALAQVYQCATHQLCLLGVEAASAAVAIDTVHLVVEPRRRLVEVGIGKISPRYCHHNVLHPALHVGYHARLLQYYRLHNLFCI